MFQPGHAKSLAGQGHLDAHVLQEAFAAPAAEESDFVVDHPNSVDGGS